MKVTINDNCIGCGDCTGCVDGVFEIGDDGLAKVVAETIPEDKKEKVNTAAEGCPASAIEVSEE